MKTKKKIKSRKNIKLRKRGGSNINEHPTNMNTESYNNEDELSKNEKNEIKKFLFPESSQNVPTISELENLIRTKRHTLTNYILSDYENTTNLLEDNLMILLDKLIEGHITNFKKFIKLIEKFSFNDIIKEVLNKRLSYLRYISCDYQCDNPDIIEYALQKNMYALKYISNEFKSKNIELLRQLLEIDGMLLEFIPDSIQENFPDLIHIALNQDINSFEFISEEIKQNNITLLRKVLRVNGMLLRYIPNSIKQNNQDLIDIALEQDINALNFVPIGLRTEDRISRFKLVSRAIKIIENIYHPFFINTVYQRLPIELKHNPQITKLAMANTNNPIELYQNLPNIFTRPSEYQTEIGEIALRRQIYLNPANLANLFNMFDPILRNAPIIRRIIGDPTSPVGRKINF